MIYYSIERSNTIKNNYGKEITKRALFIAMQESRKDHKTHL